MIVETSKRLAQRGHEVQVFHNGRHGNYEGVEYKEHDDYEPGDLTINVNYPQFHSEGKQILWTTLTNHPDLDKFEAVCCISQYARDFTHINHRNIHIVPPGYDEKEIYPGEKISKQCFYASSPDRGLDKLLEAWPEVYATHPDATLIVTYGSDLTLLGVINLGNVDKDTMNEIYRTSDVWCYPCTGGELFCMTGKKAQVSGCIPVITPAMALNETVERAFKVKDNEDYAQALSEVLAIPPQAKDLIRQDITKRANALTWDQVTDRLLEVINSVI